MISPRLDDLRVIPALDGMLLEELHDALLVRGRAGQPLHHDREVVGRHCARVHLVVCEHLKKKARKTDM